MVNCSPLINKIFSIIIQNIFVFAFLTIFFFLYVNQVEKYTFKSQVNFIVDNIFKDININVLDQKYPKNIAFILINGALDLVKMNKDIDIDKQIRINNNKIWKKAMIWLGIIITVLIFIIIILHLSNTCLTLQIHIKEALLAVFFVGLTEWVFLEIITKKYQSINPMTIRERIGKALKTYSPD